MPFHHVTNYRVRLEVIQEMIDYLTEKRSKILDRLGMKDIVDIESDKATLASTLATLPWRETNSKNYEIVYPKAVPSHVKALFTTGKKIQVGAYEISMDKKGGILRRSEIAPKLVQGYLGERQTIAPEIEV